MAAFGKRAPSDASPPPPLTVVPGGQPATPMQSRGTAAASTDVIRDQVLLRIEPAVAVRMTQMDLSVRVSALVSEIATESKLLLNRQEQQSLATTSSMTWSGSVRSNLCCVIPQCRTS
jgi:hypothetical protein